MNKETKPTFTEYASFLHYAGYTLWTSLFSFGLAVIYFIQTYLGIEGAITDFWNDYFAIAIIIVTVGYIATAVIGWNKYKKKKAEGQ